MIKILSDSRYITNKDVIGINKCIDGINKNTSLKLRQYFKGRNYKTLLLKKRIKITNANDMVMVSIFFKD